MKNLPLYLSAHPISSALSLFTRCLGQDSPFLSYSSTFPSLGPEIPTQRGRTFPGGSGMLLPHPSI